MEYKLWSFYRFYPPALGTFWNSAIRPSVPRRSCLGYRHAGCLQLSHRRPPEICGLRTRPRTDVDPPRFSDLTAIGGGGHIVSPPPGRYPVFSTVVAKAIFAITAQKLDPVVFHCAASASIRRRLADVINDSSGTPGGLNISAGDGEYGG